MKLLLSRSAPRCSRQRRQLFGAVQACAGRLGAAALSPSLAAREGGDALTAGRPLLDVPRLRSRQFRAVRDVKSFGELSE
ncbi:hypothetical protein KYG_12189 [Acidovorax sp. NO-1]|nr:hypothetical protein KYG_12189 [Acidovorax sp. NO-1]